MVLGQRMGEWMGIVQNDLGAMRRIDMGVVGGIWVIVYMTLMQMALFEGLLPLTPRVANPPPREKDERREGRGWALLGG